MKELATLVTEPSVLRPRQHIFLLSHMRAYTSLFGHIMGSNPEICGYYEMHIGYYSSRSLLRQKLLYFREDRPKPGFRYMFDKILHNEHAIRPDILNSPVARVIFSLRSPDFALPSILRLYRGIAPDHPLAQADNAARYLIGRMEELRRLADRMERPYYFFDAEALKSRTAELLAGLGDWLALSEPLSTEYELHTHSAKRRYGDTSENLRAGTIVQQGSDYSGLELDRPAMEEAMAVYRKTRDRLAGGSDQSVLAG